MVQQKFARTKSQIVNTKNEDEKTKKNKCICLSTFERTKKIKGICFSTIEDKKKIE